MTGLPPAWSATATPSPQARTVVGDPLGAGATLSFETCQVQPCVLLWTVDVVPTTLPPPILLQVEPIVSPACQGPPECPLSVYLCDAPAFTQVSVDGGVAWLNGSCSVAVESGTWTTVKRLFEEAAP